MPLPSRSHTGRLSEPLAILIEISAELHRAGGRKEKLERVARALCSAPVEVAMVLEADVPGAMAHLVAAATAGRAPSAPHDPSMLRRFAHGIAAALATGAAVELDRDGTILDSGAPSSAGPAVLAQPILGPHRNEVRGVVLVVLRPGGELDEGVRGLVEVAAGMLGVLFVRDADNAGTEFLSTVSHELRTPLQAILGWAQVLAQASAGSEAWLRGVRAIERNARIEAALVDDLLDTSRAVRGGLRLASVPVGVRAAVEAALRALDHEAADRGVTVSLEVADDPGEVLGDFDRLAQVFQNLLSNAVKFTPRGGRVDVVVDRTRRSARVRVSDSGEGIDPGLLPHVFEAFWQGEGTDTRTHGGLGLGLPMVRHVVELHGGTVRAESAGPGRGATFTVEVPLLGTTSVPLDGTTRLLDGLRILVIEDDPEVREAVTLALSSFGAEVIVAASADEALAASDRGAQPDVVVSDIRVADGDGSTLLRKLRDQAGAPPALALTAVSSGLETERVLAAGFEAHVRKPVEAAELARTIALLSGRSDSRRRALRGAATH